jgi:hypothetical protein
MGVNDTKTAHQEVVRASTASKKALFRNSARSQE